MVVETYLREWKLLLQGPAGHGRGAEKPQVSIYTALVGLYTFTCVRLVSSLRRPKKSLQAALNLVAAAPHLIR
jgi:hypothetical protein